MPGITDILQSLLPFLQQKQGQAAPPLGATPAGGNAAGGPGSPGTMLTPGMQAAAVQNGAVTPQDAATATVANAAPNAPSPQSFDPTNPFGAGNAKSLMALANRLIGGGGEGGDPRMKTARPFRSGQGAPPPPITQAAGIRPALPQQRPMAAPQPAAAMNALSAPDMRELVKQLQMLNGATGLT